MRGCTNLGFSTIRHPPGRQGCDQTAPSWTHGHRHGTRGRAALPAGLRRRRCARLHQSRVSPRAGHRHGPGPGRRGPARLYRQGCDGGAMRSAAQSRVALSRRASARSDVRRHGLRTRRWCRAALPAGLRRRRCARLHVGPISGLEVAPRDGRRRGTDPVAAAARLYRQGCDGGPMRARMAPQRRHRRGISRQQPRLSGEDRAVGNARWRSQSREMATRMASGWSQTRVIGDRREHFRPWRVRWAGRSAVTLIARASHMEDGIGTAPDPVAAQAAYRKACDLGT